MDHPSGRRHHHRRRRRSSNKHNNHQQNHSTVTAATMAGSDDPDQSDPEVWEIFNSSFSEVQTVLDRNRVLIQQVNENHQSKIPNNMAKNVALIHELNQNITKVASLYSDLSTNFSAACYQHSSGRNGKGGSSPRA